MSRLIDSPAPGLQAAAAPGPAALFRPRLKLRRTIGWFFAAICLLLSLSAVGILAALLAAIFMEGGHLVTGRFLTSLPSRFPQKAGIFTALVGTLWLIVLTALSAVPLGVGAAIYLEEYARKSRFTSFVQLNLTNLAGVPSIVYGILGLAVFVRWLQFDRSVLSGALTLTLLVLPVIIIASREAIAAVPRTLREAAFAVGATRWQMIWHHVLPASLPGILTGLILALSRAIGETAPLLLIGAASFVAFVPGGNLSEYPPGAGGLLEWLRTALFDKFTALPIQIYNWSKDPKEKFRDLAAAAILVLLAVLLTLNALAAGIRAWQTRVRR